MTMATAVVDRRGAALVKGTVVTVHGLYGGTIPLLPIRTCIQMRESFKVEAFTYQPQKQNLLESGKLLAKFLKQRKSHAEDTIIQFVTYGYGALVLRESFRHVDWNYTKSKLVMIAPPNRGIKYYRTMKRNIGIAGYGGVAADELANWTADDLDQRLGKLPRRCYPLILAGSLCLNPFNQHNYPNDGLVMVDETNLPGEFRHQVIAATHYSLALHPTTFLLTTSFLEA